MRQHGAVPTRVLALVVLAALATLATMTLPGVAQARTPAPTYYVALGDSYSVGYQPGLGSTPGYTVYVAKRTHLTLVNFGCGGATTTSILDAVGCPDVLPHTAGGVTYPTTTQIAAAEAFLTAHRGHIGLITVSIGGNDVTSCALKPNPISCVGTAVSGIATNVTALASDLRTAAGSGVPIIGLTYPDIILGAYVWPSRPPSASAVSLANLSVTAFKALINPALSKAYAQSKAAFVDVTAATGAYGSLNRTVHTKAYGTIPVPVASVCALTWFCARGDIHAHTSGYTLIGKLVVSRYATMRRA
jgi:lysophospholipase L1-like esterase